MHVCVSNLQAVERASSIQSAVIQEVCCRGDICATYNTSIIRGCTSLGLCNKSLKLQEEIAPFALENLGCSGNESLLVDCPVFDPRQPDIDTYSAGSFFEYDRLDYQKDFISPSACDPFRLSYARILCGTDESTSELCHHLCHAQ